MTAHLSFSLPDSFVESYERREVRWGFPCGGGLTLGELNFVDKYSRLKPDGTKERWHETCRRVVEGTYSILKDHCARRRTPWNEAKARRSAMEAYERMFTFKWLPPGRGIWMMGTAFVAEHGSAALQNCLAGDTVIVTEEGPQRLDVLAALGETVRVLSPKGYVEATVRAFGRQPLQRVTLKPNGDRSNVRRSYVATPNHRWWLADGTRTDALAVGDVVQGCVADVDDQTADYDYGWLHGFVFGDGCRSYTYLDGSARYDVRLCGDKDQKWLGRILAAPGWREATTPTIAAAGDVNVTGRSYDDLKAFPSAGRSANYLGGFLAGWLAADGTDRGTSQVLASQHPDAAEWLERYAAAAGWQVVGETAMTEPTNYGERKAPLRRFVLRRQADWRVVSIDDLGLEDEVYCAVVPDGEAFTLAGGVLTSNCAFVSTGSPRGLVDAAQRLMEMSMLGVGVGFDSRAADEGLRVHGPTQAWLTYTIPDTREGWCESTAALLRSYLEPGQPRLEMVYDAIRPKGAPIRGFGGVAAGPEPLQELHANLRRVLDRYAADQRSVDTMLVGDVMTMIARCVVAGNVRRSALIWLGESDDKAFLAAKNGEANPERMDFDTGWGWSSNNSILAEVGHDYSHLGEAIALNGEPGLVYLDLCRDYGRLADPPNGRDYRVMGINPCVTGDGWVLTADGPRQVRELVGERFVAMVDGKPYLTGREGFFATGTKAVYRLTTRQGYEVRLTADHQVLTVDGKRRADALEPGDVLVLGDHGWTEWDGDGTEDEGYVLGHLVGDGTLTNDRATLCVWDEDEGCDACAERLQRAVDALGHRSDWHGWFRTHGTQRWMRSAALTRLAETYGIVNGHKRPTDAVERASSAFQVGFLRGLYDADGSVNPAGEVWLGQKHREDLVRVQRMLARLGIAARIYKPAKRKKMSPFGDSTSEWRLVIGAAHAVRFGARVGFENPRKQKRLVEARAKRGAYASPHVAVFEALIPDGEEEVYDVRVDQVHVFDLNGLTVSNCGEQPLEDGELCTLVNAYPTNCADREDFMRTLKFAYLYAKAVTLLSTHWEDANEVMRRNHRIGTSMAGQAEFVERHGWAELKAWQDEGYGVVREWDGIYSEWLGVRESIKVTTSKPDGTTALLAGVTPGAAWPSETGGYLRRMRFAADAPIVDSLIAAGVPVEADVTDPRRVVAEFPTTGPDIRGEREVSVWEKAELAALTQRHWSDNAVSVTLTFRPDEVDDVGRIIHAFDGRLKTASFLPLGEEQAGGAYPQMPYEAIDADELEERRAAIHQIDRSALYGLGTEDAAGDRYCTTDHCELPLA